MSEKITVLVVEDDPGVRELLVRFLEIVAKYDVLQAESGNEAWKILEQTVPSLILTDIEMDNGSGLELAKKVAADARLETVPVFFQSASIDGTQVIEKSGVVESILATQIKNFAMISKPFSLPNIVDAVRLFLGDVDELVPIDERPTQPKRPNVPIARRLTKVV